MYLAGLVQAIFTVSVLIFFIPIYYNFYLSFLWQVRPPLSIFLEAYLDNASFTAALTFQLSQLFASCSIADFHAKEQFGV